jgi:acetyl-CoA C-acetyltransferase
MDQPVILSAVRTPVGKFLGNLSTLSATELGSKAIAEAVRRAGIDPATVDEAIMGNVVQAGLGQNPARQAALRAGLHPRVAAMTINKVCGSGLKAVALAAQAVALNESEIVAAGGMESMSNCPYLLTKARTGYRLGNGELIDSMIQDGLWDVYENYHMGLTGELVAEKYKISREEQDKFAVEKAIAKQSPPPNPVFSPTKFCPSKSPRKKARR